MSELSKKARNRTRVQMVLTMLVIVSIIRQFFLGNYHNMFLGILTLILFMVPQFIDKKLGVTIPVGLETVILIFIFSAEILGEINARKSDEEANKERMFMEQKELARLKKDEVGDVLEADELKKTEPDSVKEQPASEVKENIDSDELSIDLVQNNQNSALKESIVKAIERQNEANKEAAAAIAENKEKQKAAEDNPAGSLPDSLSDSSDNSFSENVSKASLSLKELIENAKKKIENSCEKISREDEEEARRVAQKRIDEQADAMNIEVSVPNYSIYDTHNIQEELAKNVKNLFEDEQEDDEQPEAKDVHEDFVTWEATSEDEKDDETDAWYDERC